MPDVTFTNIKVRCPVFPHRIEPMTMEFFRTEDGGKHAAPCSGCDSANGSKICQKCTAILWDYFSKYPNEHPFSPIDPFTPEVNLLGLAP